MIKGDKLYLVVRSDLPLGSQAAQLCHAQTEFSIAHPELYREWHNVSNYICLLAVDSEDKLKSILDKADKKEIKSAYFLESDLDNSLTAIALAPGTPSRKLLSNTKLAFK
jgi:peptidyl-tRNA hydrolase